MVFFVVFLECRRYMTVKKEWISHPVVGKNAKMFFSTDEKAVVNFDIEPEFYLNRQRESCHNVFVVASFGKTHFMINFLHCNIFVDIISQFFYEHIFVIDNELDAQTYSSKKRLTPQVQYKTGSKFGQKCVRDDPVLYIELSDEEDVRFFCYFLRIKFNLFSNQIITILFGSLV